MKLSIGWPDNKHPRVLLDYMTNSQFIDLIKLLKKNPNNLFSQEFLPAIAQLAVKKEQVRNILSHADSEYDPTPS